MTTSTTQNYITPVLVITGSGGTNTAANTITFNFNKAIKDGSFTIYDIVIVNGTIDAGSFTKVSDTQYTIMVTPNLSGRHSNVAITVAENTLKNLTGNPSATIAKNTTNITFLRDKVDIDGNGSDNNLTNWDVSHVVNTSTTFSGAVAFNQNIDNWDVSNVKNMLLMFANAATFNQNIGSWDVSNVKNMLLMFYKATAFNQNIGSWDVSNVENMFFMFYKATAFNQSIGSWDISSLTNAEGMFIRTAMTVDNMDDTLRGWAKLDTAAGETAIKNNVTWDIEDYTDATAKQYLIDTYNWTINGTFDGSKTIQGTVTADTLATTSIKTTLHGLGGNDTLTGGTTNDILIGGAGDDTLTGAGGRNTFDYGFENAGNDIITDFTVGNTSINANADIIDLKDLLIGYSISNLSDFVTAAADGTGTKLTIDHNGTRALNSSITIALSNVAYSANLLDNLITNGNLILATSPTLTITGSGGASIATKIIAFNFNEAIKDGSFTVDDVGIVNGTIDTGSFTKVSDTQYTIMVTPNLSGRHSNVAITVAANTFTNLAGNPNATATKNTTSVTFLRDKVDIDGNGSDDDLTNWDVSYVIDMSGMFSDATAFNQDIDSWDVSNVTNMNSMFVKATAFNQNIDSWDVSNVKNMLLMFYKATAFNQNIDSWDVSNVKSVILMFYEATAFNQSIGSWDISSLTNAEGMFIRTAMTVDNMDDTLRGWAKLDTAAGETAIKNNVTWDIEDYTDATAKQYLIDTYNWTINGTFDGSKTIQGTVTADTLATTSIKTTLHGLGGNDTLTGGTTNDILIGGAGDDTLTGAGGRNTFDYGFENAGNDIITDFTVGNTSINANADIIVLKDLLIGYNSASNLSDFVTAAADGTGTKLTIDHNSMVTPDSQVTIALTGVSYSTNLLSGMITDGNLVLE